MAYLGLGMILLIAYIIQAIDNKVNDKAIERCEQIHEDMYEWIDEHYTGHTAREYKAQVDSTINATFKDNGREYKPALLQQVLKGDELKERTQAEFEGNADDKELRKAQALDNLQELIDNCPLTPEQEWFYGEHTDDERREHLIASLMTRCNIGREEAEARADNFIKFTRGA